MQILIQKKSATLELRKHHKIVLWNMHQTNSLVVEYTFDIFEKAC